MALAQTFRESSVLVLPSLEEGFGLVVAQALHCGLPCIVSDRVGAKDFIEHRVNGSIFPAGDSHALADELEWWSRHPRRVKHSYSWPDAANQLIKLSGHPAPS
jgi:glycosyltransferase involved in cell wall biosynthesis